ncbi:hypothetical protein [Streptomyces albireticuli]|uniref:hypothetical protein n=1 Tax=Streptomyces albireticuli TaxID=1940 RepID=UPI0036B5F43D
MLITGINSKKPKLVPHHTSVVRGGAPIRCQGNHRLVLLDVAPEKWEKRRRNGVEPSVRRSARQRHKPMPAPTRRARAARVEVLDIPGWLTRAAQP